MGNNEGSSNAGAMRAQDRNHQTADIEARMAAQMAAQIAGDNWSQLIWNRAAVLTTDFPNYSATIY